MKRIACVLTLLKQGLISLNLLLFEIPAYAGMTGKDGGKLKKQWPVTKSYSRVKGFCKGFTCF
jgi:hypothetical protein